MFETTNQIIEFYKKDVDEEVVIINIYEIIKSINDTHKSHAKHKKIKIHLNGDYEHDLLSRKNQFIQILDNLVSNAVKYFLPTLTSIYNFIMDVRNLQYLRFVIQDHGKGLKPDDLDSIRNKEFRFAQNDDSLSSGLGLSIVDKYLSDFKGKMWVESELKVQRYLLSFQFKSKQSIFYSDLR